MKFTLKKKKPQQRQPDGAVGKRLRGGGAVSLPFDTEEGEGEVGGRDAHAEDTLLPPGGHKKRKVDVEEGGVGGLEDELAERRRLSQTFRAQGDQFAEDGKYREALAKWEAALVLTPHNAVLHEQKAQVLLEVGDAWGAIKSATRATELEPSWAEAWITLARAQVNYGEPLASIASSDKALMIKPDSETAKADRETAQVLVKKWQQLHSSGLCEAEGRFVVRDNEETS